MHAALIWTIAVLTIALMLLRPRGISEAVWTSLGAILLVVTGLLSVPLAGQAIARGLNVYLFLTGMMLLAELGKRYGVFDWLAALAVRGAKGSPRRLFSLIFIVAVIVTAFLSNDATAVVLTPAVLAAVRRARANPLPYLFICALIANAAGFLLPISNPANLVVFNHIMPPLVEWLAMFLLPATVAITVTFILLRAVFHRDLSGECNGHVTHPPLSHTGRMVLYGMSAVAALLLVASGLHWNLGLPACLAAAILAVFALVHRNESPMPLLRGISWSVLPLVASLFIIVAATEQAGALNILRHAMQTASTWNPAAGALAVGAVTAFGTNIVNNLPLGLIAGSTLRAAPVHTLMQKAVLIGIDLGPNLSVAGSLATLLWLIALRKEGLEISAGRFLKAGLILMPPTLLLTLLAALLTR
ncbi:MAG: arsenic transporter [Acidobacteriaceae bacterium]